MNDPRCSMPVVVTFGVASVAAFFAMGAAIGRFLYERRHAHA